MALPPSSSCFSSVFRNKADYRSVNSPCSLPRSRRSTWHFECSFSVPLLPFLPVKSRTRAQRKAWVGLFHQQVAWCLDAGACRMCRTPAERLTCYQLKSDSTSRGEPQTRHGQDMNKESTNRSATFRTIRADSHYTSRFRSVAERHRSVNFSHVQLNGDVHTDRNVSVTSQFRSVAVPKRECLT